MSANANAITVMHRALDLLGRASADWRNGGQCDGAALHWPVAVDLARRELQQALGAVERQPHEPTQDTRAGMAWFNQLSPTQRLHWLTCARSAIPADAWEAFKAGDAPR
jgi:hypothetical protein